MENNSSKNDILKSLNALPPRIAFFAGFAGGVLLILAVGFFILLGIMVKDSPGAKAANKDNGDAAVVVDNNAQPADTVPTADLPAITDQDHVRGAANAKVTLVEYSDFECPYCQKFHETMKQVLSAYPNDVRVIYRHFPLTSLHAGAMKKAEGSECANELGGSNAFWGFHDAMFEGTVTVDGLADVADGLGLDKTAFQKCLDSGKYTSVVQGEEDAGATAGVTGTPASFVIGPDGEPRLVPGALPIESMKQLIDSVLK